MKNPIRHLIPFLAIAPAGATVLVQDDFDDNSINTAIWTVDDDNTGHNRAFNDANLTEVDEEMEFDGRPRLSTVSTIDPDAYTGGITITGQFRFETGGDVVKVLTRSDGTASGLYAEISNGIEFVFNVNGGAVSPNINSRGGSLAIGSEVGGTPIDLVVDDVVTFEIVDDGVNGLSFTITRPSDGATSTTTAVLTTDTTTYSPLVSFYNREDRWANGVHISHLDDVVISSNDDAPLGEVTAATLTADESTFLVGAPGVPLTAEGTFTNAGTINVTPLGSPVVTYSSTNTSVATVSEFGLVTLGEPGTADITATVVGDNTTQATSAPLSITVEAPINFNFTPYDESGPNYFLAYGSQEDLTVTADSASLTGVAVEGYTGFSYSSGDSLVVDVDANTGVFSPLVEGSTTLTAELLVPGQSAFSEGITITTEDADDITATIDHNALVIGGPGAAVTLEVTTPNIPTPIVVNGVIGTTFSTNGGSDIFVDSSTGVVTPGTDTNALGDSIITGEWLLSDGSSTISETVTVTLSLPSPKPATLLHCYDFTGTPDALAPENTVIADTVGSAHGEVLGAGAVFSSDGNSLILPGGDQATGAYVDLPDNLVSNIPNVDTVGVTFELWLTKDAGVAWARALDFGNNFEPFSFVNLMPQRGGGGGVISSEFTLDRATFGGQFASSTATMPAGERSHLVLTIDPETASREIYLDGQPIGSFTLASDNRSLASLNDVNNWLGCSNGLPTDPLLQGTYDNFCLYSGIMTPEEVMAAYDAGKIGGDYTSWATDNGIDGEPSGGDFENDGLSNFLEYALGKNPTVSDAPAGTFDGSSVSFTKGADAITNGDVQWVIEESDDLGVTDAWEAVVTHLAGDATPTISYTLPTGETKKFVRLNATEVAP